MTLTTPDPANPFTDDQIRQAARIISEEEGILEIDDDATISRGEDPGCYVQAWIWVNYEDVAGRLGLPDPDDNPLDDGLPEMNSEDTHADNSPYDR
jgi:hypothetical protein